jgi:succinate dehydrogenase / fumarate reductase cytochrome b subunit
MGIVYINLYEAFQVWWIAWGYILAVGIVAWHIYHGAWSVFQTLGWNNADRNQLFRCTAVALSVGLFLAFASVPLMFFTGVMPAPAQSSTSVADTHTPALPLLVDHDGEDLQR